jgi:hypothetical protein
VRSNQLSYRPEQRPVRPTLLFPVAGLFEKGFEDQVNMLSSYAAHDHRAFPERQRRLDSGSHSLRQERIPWGTWQHPANSDPKACPRYAERWNECHDVLS